MNNGSNHGPAAKAGSLLEGARDRVLRRAKPVHLALVAIASFGVSACAAGGGGGGGGGATPAGAAEVSLIVINDLTPPSAITLYMVPETGGRRRLGVVQGGGRQTFNYEPTSRNLQFRIVAEVVGENDVRSEAFNLVGIASVEWQTSRGTVRITRAEAPVIPQTTGGEGVAIGEPPQRDEFTGAAEEALEQAAEFKDGGLTDQARTRYQAASEAADQAIAANPRNPLAWSLGAQARMGAGDYQGADTMFARAVELRPIYEFELDPMREAKWIELYNEAAPFINEQRFADAMPLLEGANAIYKGRPEIMYLLGQLYQQEGRYEESLEAFDMTETVIHSDLANDLDSATLATWHETEAELPRQRTQSLIGAGRYEEALDGIRALRVEDPENLQYIQSLASLFIQLEMPDSAAAVYDDLLNQPGLGPIDFFNIGVGLYNIQDWLNSARAFKATADAWPKNRDAIELWAVALQQEYIAVPEPPEEALTEIITASETWLELDPYSQNAHLILARAVNIMGDGQRAGQLLTAVEGFPVLISDLQYQPDASGGIVTGSLENQLVEQGGDITVEITFFSANERSIGTAPGTIQAPAAGMSDVFQVSFESDDQVTGYTYSISH